MRRVLSTYQFVNEELTADHIGRISAAGAAAVELFCSRPHFDYASANTVREVAAWLGEHKLEVHALHSPTERDSSPRRESGVPVSIADPERVRRIDAVDEVKRALEVAELLPFKFLVQHLGHSHEPADERRSDAAFNSLEHLTIFAKHRGVTIALENIPSELASPWNLRRFIEETRLRDLRLCFDVGHAHIEDGVESSFEMMREMVVTTHVHDNHGEKDEHLLPWEGTVNWEKTLAAFAAAGRDLPVVLELKDAPGHARAPEKIAAAFDRIEKSMPARA